MFDLITNIVATLAVIALAAQGLRWSYDLAIVESTSPLERRALRREGPRTVSSVTVVAVLIIVGIWL